MFANGKSTLYLDLKREQGTKILRQVAERSDVLIDPFRPGVMERLGLGSKELCELNSKLVYARLSSFGQTGSWSQKAGHDINFVSLSGVMSRLGFDDRPPIAPLNLLGDFAGGACLTSLGIMMALFERNSSGKGQVVDCSMTEGVAYIGSFLWETLKQKDMFWHNWPRRSSNLLDYGSPFYRCYETKDGGFLSVGALEEKFYKNFIDTIGLDEETFNRFDMDSWDAMAEEISRIISTKTRAEWEKLFESTDACVAPVLSMEEAEQHDHHISRNAFCSKSGLPNPAPKLSRTPGVRSTVEPKDLGSETRNVLTELGYSKEEMDNLAEEGIIDGQVSSETNYL